MGGAICLNMATLLGGFACLVNRTLVTTAVLFQGWIHYSREAFSIDTLKCDSQEPSDSLCCCSCRVCFVSC